LYDRQDVRHHVADDCTLVGSLVNISRSKLVPKLTDDIISDPGFANLQFVMLDNELAGHAV
jgi:hypothetical protein